MSRAIYCDCCGAFSTLETRRGGLPVGWIKIHYSVKVLPQGNLSWSPEGKVELCEVCDFIDPRKEVPPLCPHRPPAKKKTT
jgi:hypothetical protein